MNIVIYGLAKTGTSILFARIRKALPPGTIGLFEPVSRGLRPRLQVALRTLQTGRLRPDVVAKVLPFEPDRRVRLRDFERFDKQILIVRDPRDRLISVLLYRLYDASFFADDAAVHAFLGLLRRKEAEPASVSLIDLFALLARLDATPFWKEPWTERYRDYAVTHPLAFHNARPHLHAVRYKDVVDGRVDALEAYLGFSLDRGAEVDAHAKRVARSRGHGGWRDWWTPADVERLGPLLQPYLDAYYPDADWALAEAPVLDPKHGSRYVARLADERRAKAGLPPLPR